jgi:hypothetical protein
MNLFQVWFESRRSIDSQADGQQSCVSKNLFLWHESLQSKSRMPICSLDHPGDTITERSSSAEKAASRHHSETACFIGSWRMATEQAKEGDYHMLTVH